MTTDVCDRVAALRPAPTLDPTQREAMLTAITGSDRNGTDRTAVRTPRAPWSPRRRQFVVGASLAGLAAAAAIVIPAVVPSSTPVVGHASPAAAAELRRLAVVVEHHRSVTLGPHQYLYIAEDEVQHGLLGTGANGNVFGTSITHRQGWTSRTGRLWRRDDSTNPIDGHRVDDYVIPPNADDSPQHLASLPTNVGRLRAHLRADFPRRYDLDRNVFQEIEFILEIGIAPGSLRSAALQVLAETDGVTVTRHVHDSAGRPAVRFTLTYHHANLREVDSLYLDERDARVLETTSDDDATHDGSFGSHHDTFADTVTAERIVHSVPAAVRRNAAKHH